MKALELKHEEEQAFATAALALRCDERPEGQSAAPITVDRVTEARRIEDTDGSLWLAMDRIEPIRCKQDHRAAAPGADAFTPGRWAASTAPCRSTARDP